MIPGIHGVGVLLGAGEVLPGVGIDHLTQLLIPEDGRIGVLLLPPPAQAVLMPLSTPAVTVLPMLEVSVQTVLLQEDAPQSLRL